MLRGGSPAPEMSGALERILKIDDRLLSIRCHWSGSGINLISTISPEETQFNHAWL